MNFSENLHFTYLDYRESKKNFKKIFGPIRDLLSENDPYSRDTYWTITPRCCISGHKFLNPFCSPNIAKHFPI